MVNYIAISIPAFFLLIGLELLVARRQGRSVYRFADAITDLSFGILGSVLVWGGLLERRRWALGAELLRLLAIGTGVLWLASGGAVAPVGAAALLLPGLLFLGWIALHRASFLPPASTA